MMVATPAMLTETRGRPGDPDTRRALLAGGASTPSNAPSHPLMSPKSCRGSRATAIRCRCSPNPLSLADCSTRPRAGWTGRAPRRARPGGTALILANAMDYAVELGVLDIDPIRALKWTAPRVSGEVDRRCSVANPGQARTLLDAVRAQQPSGPRLVAFFGLMYYAGLRPEEAVSLSTDCVSLPPRLRRTAGANCISATRRPTPAASGPTTAVRERGGSSSIAPMATAGSCPSIPSWHGCCATVSRSSALPGRPAVQRCPRRRTADRHLPARLDQSAPGGSDRGRGSLTARPAPI